MMYPVVRSYDQLMYPVVRSYDHRRRSTEAIYLKNLLDQESEAGRTAPESCERNLESSRPSE